MLPVRSRLGFHGLPSPMAKEQCHTCLLPFQSCVTVGVQAGEEKPIDLCDSDDDDAPAQQPAGAQGHRQRSQAAAHPPEARRVKQQPAPGPGPGPEDTAEAVQRPEAKRLKAGAIQKPAQGTETQHLGIRDPRPPKLSGNNALLKELAEGTDRVRKSSDISCFSVSQSLNGGPCDCCLAAADMPADHAAELAAEAGLCACPRALACSNTTVVPAAGEAGKAAGR